MKTKTLGLKREVFDAYLLILPLLLLLLVFILYPVLSNFYYSFTKWNGMGTPKLVGLDNYKKLLNDDLFGLSLKNTGILLCYIPLGTLLPLIIAAIMRVGLKGWTLFRGLLYLPNVLGYVIIGLLSSLIFREIGPFNAVLRAVGLGSLALDWLNSSILAINLLGLLYGVWIPLGFGCIYFLAAMSGIDSSLYDAADIDGAGWWGSFWNVTIPSIRFSIEFWLVLSVIAILARAFPFIYTFSRGGPGFGTFTVEYAIYNAGFESFKMGYACTWATVLFVFCGLIATVQINLMRRNASV